MTSPEIMNLEKTLLIVILFCTLSNLQHHRGGQ